MLVDFSNMIEAKAIIVLIFVSIVALKATINPHGPTVVLDFTNCMQTILENDFKDTGVLIFANAYIASTSVSKIKAELLTRIHEKVKYTVEVKSPQYEVDVCDDYNESFVMHRDVFEPRPLGAYFIIVIDTYKDFPHLVSRLIRSRSWNPSAKFLIMLFNFAADKLNKLFVEKITSCLFKYNVLNVVVIVPQSNNVRNGIVYGWRPYDPPQYCGYYNETAYNRILIENTCEEGKLKNKNSVFGDKIPTDMTGCVLYIIALRRQPFVSSDVDEANLEKVLINEVVKPYRLTTSYRIINSSRGEREDDGQWNGALKELTMKKGQILLGGIFPDFDVHEDFDCSIPYLADSYTWVVPRAYSTPPWVALVITFQKLVWYSVIIGFSTCALFWRILGQISGDSRRNRSLKHCFLNAWICSLGYCAYIRPTKQSLRVFFIFFNIYCILIVTAYQTTLIYVLKTPTFQYQIKTIEDLVESGMKFGGFEELHDSFLNSSDPLDSYIYDNWIDVTDLSMAMIDVTVHRNFSLLCSRLELDYVSAVVPDLSDNFGNFKYYAFSMNVFSVPMETVALRGFGYMRKISEGLSLFKQAGINEAVRKHFSSFNARRRAKLLRSLLWKKTDINSLSLQHLQGGFLILALGYATGTLVLALEVAWNTQFIRRIFARRNIGSST